MSECTRFKLGKLSFDDVGVGSIVSIRQEKVNNVVVENYHQLFD